MMDFLALWNCPGLEMLGMDSQHTPGFECNSLFHTHCRMKMKFFSSNLVLHIWCQSHIYIYIYIYIGPKLDHHCACRYAKTKWHLAIHGHTPDLKVEYIFFSNFPSYQWFRNTLMDWMTSSKIFVKMVLWQFAPAGKYWWFNARLQ